MIDFEALYKEILNEFTNNQKRLPVDSILTMYFGYSDEGYMRLSFMSSIEAPQIKSTKFLRITQGFESEKVYWTCIDLLQSNADKVFFSFCADMVQCLEGINDEYFALLALKRRYQAWKALFKAGKGHRLTQEELRGLFGELYYLKNYIIKEYGVRNAILGWAGPDAKSKDFSIDNDWFEVKTIGANQEVIHISSLSQLSSNIDGHLVVIRTESMSELYENKDCSIIELFNSIFELLGDEELETEFAKKMANYGFDMNAEEFGSKFEVKSIDKYIVNEKFPCLREKDIKHEAIADVAYSLFVKLLSEYKEK